MIKEITAEEVRAFIKKRVQINPDTECWEWQRQKRSGYGIVDFNTRARRFTNESSAHRVSYTVFVGSIPDGQVIRHRCNNRLCSNPEHLKPGSQRENCLDKTEPLNEMTDAALRVRRMLLQRQLDEVLLECRNRGLD